MNNKLINLVRYTASVGLMLGIYYLIKWIISSASFIPLLNLSAQLTESLSWVYAVEHHIFQLLLALIVIAVLSTGNYKEWGFNFKNFNKSLQILKSFCYYYLIYFIGISFLIQLFFYPGPPFSHSYNWTQILGYLAFGFILTGLSEEILFRGLMQTYLTKLIPGSISWKNIELPVGGFIAVIIFVIAHIGFTIYPPEIWHFQPLQILQSFILGVFYTWAYYKTESLFTPILAHNISNGSIWVMDYVLFYIHQ